MVMKKMNVINWNRKIYTVPQFSKLYREYAQRVKDGNAEPVAPSSWRRIKQHLVNNKRITAVEIYFDAIILKETGKDHKYAVETTSGLGGFINFIYQVGDMILNATDSTTAKCNCADILSTSTTNIVDWNRTGSIIGTDWNPVVTVPLSEANEKAIAETKKIVAEHADEIKVLGNRASTTECQLSDLVGQVFQAAQDNYNQDIRINDVQSNITEVGYAVNELCDRIDALDRRMMDNLIEINERLNTKVDKSNEDTNCEESKENSFMNKNFMNFKFGKVESDDVRVSMYGIAIKNIDGRYVSWDVKNHSVMDVEIMNMPCGDFLYMMPVAIKDIKSGDVVIHNRVPMFVVEVHTSTLKVIDIREGAEKEIYLTKSPFGFNFATKVVSLIDMTSNQANADNPFGNFLPFMLMSDGKMDSDMLPMMMLMGGANGFTNMASNPMMLYFMMKDGGNMSDMLPLMLMMNQSAAPVEHKCNCECHNEIVEG